MTRDRVAEPVPIERSAAERMFSLAGAQHALVLVRRVARDIVARHKELLQLKQRRDEVVLLPASDELVEHLSTLIGACVAELNRFHQELTDVGCVLRDWSTGAVDFPSELNGERVWLSWQLDEDEVGYWHPLHTSHGSREKLATLAGPTVGGCHSPRKN